MGRKAIVQAIYEPPQVRQLRPRDVPLAPLSMHCCARQENHTAGFMLAPDPHEEAVEAVAAALGLSRVGWIFSHLPRSYPMSSYEIRQARAQPQQRAAAALLLTFCIALWQAARFQLIHPRPDGPGSPFVSMTLTQNAAGEVEPAAMMVSDQVRLCRSTMAANAVVAMLGSHARARRAVCGDGARRCAG